MAAATLPLALSILKIVVHLGPTLAPNPPIRKNKCFKHAFTTEKSVTKCSLSPFLGRLLYPLLWPSQKDPHHRLEKSSTMMGYFLLREKSLVTNWWALWDPNHLFFFQYVTKKNGTKCTKNVSPFTVMSALVPNLCHAAKVDSIPSCVGKGRGRWVISV